jgi:hypothetical protein
MNGTFKRGRKQPLNESDISDVIERDSTQYLANKLERYCIFFIRADTIKSKKHHLEMT